MLHHLHEKRRTATTLRERGASAVEYGLLIAGIAALIVALVFLLGGTIKKKFDDTCKAVQQSSTCADQNPPAAPAGG